MQEHRNSLPAGYRLHWYVIKNILGQGGFGITYLAEDTNLNQLVAIKEYLPAELATRDQDDSIYPLSGEYGEQYKWGLDRFMSEAKTLAQFKHPNIVRVLTVFPENNTAYMVMEYEQGQGLHEILKDKGTLDEKESLAILMPLLDGLEEVHKNGFIHRDIKPPNIFIRANGSPVLLDFGSARQSLGEQTRTLTSMVSPGFAPFEQYVSKSDKQGPWTDIYGLAATLYRAAVGRSPAEAMDRSEALLHTQRDPLVGALEIQPQGYSNSFLLAIDQGLAFKTGDRPQSVNIWRESITGSSASAFENIASPLTPDIADEIHAEEATAKITIKTPDKETNTKSEALNTPPKKWYRKPWKVVLVCLFVLFILASVDDEKKTQSDGDDSQSGKPSVQITDTSDAKLSDVLSLLDRAAGDIDALRLTSPSGNNAVEKLQKVLAIDADNEDAIQGLNQVIEKYLELGRAAMSSDKLPLADEYLDKAESINLAHSGLMELRRELDRRQSAVKPDSEDTGTDEIAEISAADKGKLARIQRQLKRNPDSERAKRELRKLTEKYEELIKEAIAEKRYQTATAYIDAMLELAPGNKKLLEVKREIEKRIN